QLCARRVPHDEDDVRIAAVVGSVIVGPVDRLCHILSDLLNGHARPKTVIDRDEDEAFVSERLGFLLHVFLVARMPTSSVNPNDNGMILAFGWGVDIEGLLFVLRLAVGQTKLDLRLGSDGRGSDEQQGCKRFHGKSPKAKSLVEQSEGYL